MRKIRLLGPVVAVAFAVACATANHANSEPEAPTSEVPPVTQTTDAVPNPVPLTTANPTPPPVELDPTVVRATPVPAAGPAEYVVTGLPFDCSAEDDCYADYRKNPDGSGGIWVIVNAPNPN